jgi:hypothetical protein
LNRYYLDAPVSAGEESMIFGDMTQAEIGRRLGISQMHVSRLLDDALTRLRDSLTAGTHNWEQAASATMRTGSPSSYR